MKWIRKLLKIVREYNADQHRIHTEINEQRLSLERFSNIFKQHTSVNADIHPHSPDRDYVVVIGRFRNIDYVRTFTLDSHHFKHTVEQMIEMEKTYGRGRLDCPPSMTSILRRY